MSAPAQDEKQRRGRVCGLADPKRRMSIKRNCQLAQGIDHVAGRQVFHLLFVVTAYPFASVGGEHLGLLGIDDTGARFIEQQKGF